MTNATDMLTTVTSTKPKGTIHRSASFSLVKLKATLEKSSEGVKMATFNRLMLFLTVPERMPFLARMYPTTCGYSFRQVIACPSRWQQLTAIKKTCVH